MINKMGAGSFLFDGQKIEGYLAQLADGMTNLIGLVVE
jgi:hypothetical protein